MDIMDAAMGEKSGIPFGSHTRITYICSSIDKLYQLYYSKDYRLDNRFCLVYCKDTERVYLPIDGKILAITRKNPIKAICCNCGEKLEPSMSSIVKCPKCGKVQDIEFDLSGIDVLDNSALDSSHFDVVPLKSNMSLEEYERTRDINEGIMVADYNKLPPIIKDKVSEIESSGEEEYIHIPLGDPLNFHPSPEEFEDLKAFADKNGEIKIGG